MGLQVANLEDATKNADVVMLLLPDQIRQMSIISNRISY